MSFRVRTLHSAAFDIIEFRLALLLSVAIPAFLHSVSMIGYAQTNEQKTIALQGHIVNIDGTPAVDSAVTYSTYLDHSIATTKSDSQGKFKLKVPQIEYFGSLVARSTNGKHIGFTSLSQLNAQTIKQELSVELEECLETTVDVRHNGKPLAGAIVLADRQWKMKTDANGRVVLRMPKSKPLYSVWVFAKTKGVAFWYPKVIPSSVESARKNQPKQLTLDLLESRKCTVRILNEHKDPIPNFEIFPFFRVEGDSNRKFLPQMPETYAKTDQTGTAVFDWIPVKPNTRFIPSIVDRRYRQIESDDHSTEELKEGTKVLTVRKVNAKVKVAGKVVGPTGANLAGVLIRGSTYDSQTGFHSFSSVAKDNGEFEAAALPGLNYHVVAMGSTWSSDVTSAVLVDKQGITSKQIALDLYPSTPVTISVTQGKDFKPVTSGDVMIEQSVLVPGARVSLRRYIPVDDNGQIKFGIGKGKWTFRSRSGKSNQDMKAKIRNEEPLAFSMHYAWTGEHNITGTVLDVNGKAIKKANVTLIDYEYRMDKSSTESNNNGAWSINSDVRANFAALTFSKDKKLAGLALLHGPSQLPAELTLAPSATVNGTILDRAGKPVLAGKNVQVIYDVILKTITPFKTKGIICIEAKTNDQGKFQFRVPSGVEFRLGLKIDALNSHYFGDALFQYSAGEVAEETLSLGDLTR